MGEEGQERQSWVGNGLGGHEVSEVGESRGLVVGEVVVGEAKRWVRNGRVSGSAIRHSCPHLSTAGVGHRRRRSPRVTDSDRVHVQRGETDFQVWGAPFPVWRPSLVPQSPSPFPFLF